MGSQWSEASKDEQTSKSVDISLMKEKEELKKRE